MASKLRARRRRAKKRSATKQRRLGQLQYVTCDLVDQTFFRWSADPAASPTPGAH